MQDRQICLILLLHVQMTTFLSGDAGNMLLQIQIVFIFLTFLGKLTRNRLLLLPA